VNLPYFYFFGKAEHCKQYTELQRSGTDLNANSGPHTDEPAHFHACRYRWPPTAVFRAVELPWSDLGHIPVVSHLRPQYL